MHTTSQHCRRRSLFALLLAASTIAACADRELVITDFSKKIQLESDAEREKVVGLHVSAMLSSGPDIIMSFGCKGKIHHQITVTADITLERRLDCYTTCAEVSFEFNPSVRPTMRLRYRFQEM